LTRFHLGANGHLGVMLALILWFALGPRAAGCELLAELAVGLMLYGGGGGKRVRTTLRVFAQRTTRQRLPVRGAAIVARAS
jgi:hypothetical protein